MGEVYDFQSWIPESLPAITSVWGAEVGRLIGGGAARFLWQRDYYCPHIVTVGRGTVRTAHGKWYVAPGDAFCLWPGQLIEYAQVPGEPWEFCWVTLAGEGCEALVRACGFQPHRLVVEPAQPHRARQQIQALHAYYQQPAAVRECYQALAMLCDFVAAFRHPLPEALAVDRLALLAQEAEAAIQSQLHTGINVAELARHLGVSRATLLRAFTRYVGSSPQSYLQQARLQAAQQLLAQTDTPIATIAATTGFASVKYFLQSFRRVVGITPGAWRRRARG